MSDVPARPDCRFESVCGSSAYFSANGSFVPVLEAQRDHAADRDQHHRVDLFTMLIDRTRTEHPWTHQPEIPDSP